MDQGNSRRYVKVRLVYVVVAILIVAAFCAGLILGKDNTDKDVETSAGSVGTNSQTEGMTRPSNGIKSLASYTLPSGWTEASCDNVANTIYIAPTGAVNCGMTTLAPILISIDPSNARDCNDLQNVQDVKKHTCISLFINGHKSLHSLTEFLPSSSYKQDTTLNGYYIDLGKNVLLVEYRYTTDNQYQAAFDTLASSVNAKP